MKRVKGTVLVDFCKTIRADKSGAYQKYLTDEDQAILHSKIIPSAWYPYDTFKNCFNAIYEVLAKKNLNTVKDWGKLYGKAIMGGIYKGLLKQGEPLEYIKKYEVYIRNFLDFGEMEIIEEKPNQVLMKLSQFDPDFPPLYAIMQGWLECTMEMCGAKDLRLDVQKKGPADSHDAAIRLSWSA
jgi:uncharacterized protein (TIGR02265 family)